MEQQLDMFEEKRLPMRAEALKAHLTQENAEVAVQVLDAATWLHGALANYQTGIVDCELSRLGGGDRSAELKRLWANTYTHWKSLESLLAKWKPISLDADASVERKLALLKKQHEHELAMKGKGE